MSGVALTGPSAWPGEDPLLAHQAALEVLADPPSGVRGAAALLALPARGPWAEPVGRTLALCESMPASLEPHGWRLGLVADAFARRAARLLGSDLEAFALAAFGYVGPVTVPLLGPFSLAASVWLPVGDRVVSDSVALDDLIGSIALGVSRHVAAVVAAGDGRLEPDIVVHEPLLAQVLAGAVPTFSGMGRLRALPAEAVSRRLTDLVAAWSDRRVVVAVPPDAAVIRAVGAARPHALQLDVTRLSAPGWEALAEQVEAGVEVRCAVVSQAASDEPTDPAAVAQSVLAPWRALGLTTAERTFTLLPRSGVGEVSLATAVATLRATARAAVALGDLLAR